MDLAEQLGGTIRRLRTARGLNGVRFSEMMGKKPGVVSAWENGDSVPDVDNLVKVAAALGLTLAQLFVAAGLDPAPEGMQPPTPPAPTLPDDLASTYREVPETMVPLVNETWAAVMKMLLHLDKNDMALAAALMAIKAAAEKADDKLARRGRPRARAVNLQRGGVAPADE